MNKKETKVTVDPDVDEKLFRQLCKVIIGQFGVCEDAVKMDASITEDLGADSLDNVELIMAVEEEFAITITEEEAEKLHTVKDFYDFVKNKTGDN